MRLSLKFDLLRPAAGIQRHRINTYMWWRVELPAVPDTSARFEKQKRILMFKYILRGRLQLPMTVAVEGNLQARVCSCFPPATE